MSASHLEAAAVVLVRLRDAAGRIDREGLVVADDKGRPGPHPAIELERKYRSDLDSIIQSHLRSNSHRI